MTPQTIMNSTNLFIILLAIATLWISTLQQPDGFLNINCGASKNETDDKGLNWISDSYFIKRRDISTLPPFAKTQLLQLQYQSLAYFTNLRANKSCYVLPVRPGIVYLVRATFFYGDFESLVPNLASKFDLLIQGILWTKVDLENFDSGLYRYYEMILEAKGENLNLCLARNSYTQDGNYVFISTIELRKLESSMYNSTDFDKKALVFISRKKFGVSKDEAFRYPADPFDRIWEGYNDSSMKSTRSSLPNISFPNQPPLKVLETSVTRGLIEDMTISGPLNNIETFSPGSYYFALYFCNLNQSSISRGPAFKVLISNETETNWLNFNDSQCWYVIQNLELGVNSGLSVTLSPADGTDVPPFINAAEVYKIVDIQNTTHSGDVNAIRNIAETINAPDDWAGGDLCLPVGHPVTGIICNEDSPPRVIILNLANTSLVGNIPQSIANLTALIQILLGNNSLSGVIPDLSSLQNLTTLEVISGILFPDNCKTINLLETFQHHWRSFPC